MSRLKKFWINHSKIVYWMDSVILEKLQEFILIFYFRDFWSKIAIFARKSKIENFWVFRLYILNHINNPNRINLPSPHPQWRLFSFFSFNFLPLGVRWGQIYSIGTDYISVKISETENFQFFDEIIWIITGIFVITNLMSVSLYRRLSLSGLVQCELI